MSNQWVEHVRKYAKANNITYMCAITEASKTYKKDDKLKSTPKTTPVEHKQYNLRPLISKREKEQNEMKKRELIHFSNVFGPSRTISNLVQRTCLGRVKICSSPLERLDREGQSAPSSRWAAKGRCAPSPEACRQTPPTRQGPTLIFCAATAIGITTLKTCVSAAAKTLPTTPTRER